MDKGRNAKAYENKKDIIHSSWWGRIMKTGGYIRGAGRWKSLYLSLILGFSLGQKSMVTNTKPRGRNKQKHEAGV